MNYSKQNQCICAVSSLPDRKTSRTALQFLGSSSNRFSLLCSCLAVLDVCVHTYTHLLPAL